VVAVGAAIQAGIISGEFGKDIVLVDVTPLSLGVETQGGIFDKLIDRNTTIPTKRSRVYTTAADNQPEVEIHILQGERPMARDNKSLGRFHLAGIPPAPARVPQIEVTLDIDKNGILQVSAQEKGTGAKQSITISGSGNLSRDQIDQMVREAEMNADADKKTQELIELRNKAEGLALSSEKALREMGESVDGSTKDSITDKIEAVREAIKGEDRDAIQAAHDALEADFHALSAKLYENASAAADASEQGGATEEPTSDDVIDAEFKEAK
ncbi:hypothetical protein FGG08_002683, partial [Glutinoglossum americanum]